MQNKDPKIVHRSPKKLRTDHLLKRAALSQKPRLDHEIFLFLFSFQSLCSSASSSSSPDKVLMERSVKSEFADSLSNTSLELCCLTAEVVLDMSPYVSCFISATEVNLSEGRRTETPLSLSLKSVLNLSILAQLSISFYSGTFAALRLIISAQFICDSTRSS